MTRRSMLFASAPLIFALSVFAGEPEVKINKIQARNFFLSLDTYPANVYGLAMSRSTIRLGASNTKPERVQVWVLASDPFDDHLTYNIYAEAGLVVGADYNENHRFFTLSDSAIERYGARFTWDLTGVAPGIYKLTVGVDDGCGLCGQTVTRTVEILSTPVDNPGKPCPVNLRIRANSIFDRRTPYPTAFIAEWESDNEQIPKFHWQFEGAKLVSGQGTPMPYVDLLPSAKKLIRASISRDPSDETYLCEFQAGLDLKVTKRRR